jgi:hypothetical protein
MPETETDRDSAQTGPSAPPLAGQHTDASAAQLRSGPGFVDPPMVGEVAPVVDEYPPGWKRSWRPPAWAIAGAVVVLALGAMVLAWNTLVGTTTTRRLVAMADSGPGSAVRAGTSCEKWGRPLPGIVIVPSSRDAGCWSCGAGLPNTGYFTAAALAHHLDGSPPLPDGGRVRVTTHWLRPSEYRFVADDGTTVPLHAFHQFWCVARTGGVGP